MSTPQDIFFRMQDLKKQQKDLRTMYKDAFKNAADYQEIVEQMKEFREKKKVIEQRIKAEFSRELDKLDEIAIEMKDGLEQISTMVLDRIMKGEIVKVRDAFNNSYDPIIKVSFKKSDEQGE